VASQTDILNLALYKLAQSQTIPSITDQSKAATIAVRVWQHALDLVLSDRPWGFATKSQDAAAYPNDCLRLWKLVQRQDLLTNSSLSFWAGYEWPLPMRLLYGWNTAWGTQGTCIDANLDEAVLIYVVRLTEADTERLPPHFVEALAAKLAQMMAAPLIGDVGLNASTTLEQGYQFALARASAFDGNQGLEQDEQTPSMLARS
jgi:hypothetical protein